MIKQKPRKQRKVAFIIKDALPRFVSLVDHGANQTPFKVVKNHDHPVTENSKMPVNVSLVSFAKSVFKSVPACQEWMISKGFDATEVGDYSETDTHYVVTKQNDVVDGVELKDVPASEDGSVVLTLVNQPDEDVSDEEHKDEVVKTEDAPEGDVEVVKSETQETQEDDTPPVVADERDDEEVVEKTEVTVGLAEVADAAESFLKTYGAWKATKMSETLTTETAVEAETTEVSTETELDTSVEGTVADEVVTKTEAELLAETVAKAVAEQLEAVNKSFEDKLMALQTANTELQTKLQEFESVEQTRKSATETSTSPAKAETKEVPESVQKHNDRLYADANGLRQRR